MNCLQAPTIICRIHRVHQIAFKHLPSSAEFTGCTKCILHTETPMCVPSPASICGECLHQGSIDCLKSILKAASHPNNQIVNVLGLINGHAIMLLVWYLCVISSQKPVNDILVCIILCMKSHPISSPQAVDFVYRNIFLF